MTRLTRSNHYLHTICEQCARWMVGTYINFSVYTTTVSQSIGSTNSQTASDSLNHSPSPASSPRKAEPHLRPGCGLVKVQSLYVASRVSTFSLPRVPTMTTPHPGWGSHPRRSSPGWLYPPPRRHPSPRRRVGVWCVRRGVSTLLPNPLGCCSTSPRRRAIK
jgi:hypothetical protein